MAARRMDALPIRHFADCLFYPGFCLPQLPTVFVPGLTTVALSASAGKIPAEYFDHFSPRQPISMGLIMSTEIIFSCICPHPVFAEYAKTTFPQGKAKSEIGPGALNICNINYSFRAASLYALQSPRQPFSQELNPRPRS